jgi:hypothetical protein
MKNQIKISLCPHMHFTEQLVDVFKKLRLKIIETENIESFDSMTQEQYQVFTCNNLATEPKSATDMN